MAVVASASAGFDRLLDGCHHPLAVSHYRLRLAQRFKLAVIVAAELLFTLRQISVLAERAIDRSSMRSEAARTRSVTLGSGPWASASTSVREAIGFQPFGGIRKYQPGSGSGEVMNKGVQQAFAAIGCPPMNRYHRAAGAVDRVELQRVMVGFGPVVALRPSTSMRSPSRPVKYTVSTPLSNADEPRIVLPSLPAW